MNLYPIGTRATFDGRTWQVQTSEREVGVSFLHQCAPPAGPVAPGTAGIWSGWDWFVAPGTEICHTPALAQPSRRRHRRVAFAGYVLLLVTATAVLIHLLGVGWLLFTAVSAGVVLLAARRQYLGVLHPHRRVPVSPRPANSVLGKEAPDQVGSATARRNPRDG